jgi:hypothetical protein
MDLVPCRFDVPLQAIERRGDVRSAAPDLQRAASPFGPALQGVAGIVHPLRVQGVRGLLQGVGRLAHLGFEVVPGGDEARVSGGVGQFGIDDPEVFVQHAHRGPPALPACSSGSSTPRIPSGAVAAAGPPDGVGVPTRPGR